MSQTSRLELPEYSSGDVIFSFILTTIESSGFISLLSSSVVQIMHVMGLLLLVSPMRYAEANSASTDQSLSAGAGVVLPL